MRLSDIKLIFKAAGYNCHLWRTPENPKAPYVILENPATMRNVTADNKTKKRYEMGVAQLIYSPDDEDTEAAIDKLFDDNGIIFTHNQQYFKEQNIIIKVYSFEYMGEVN
jgi:hypothetical protein